MTGAVAQTAAFDASAAQVRETVAPVLAAVSPETLAAAVTGAVAQTAAFDASAAQVRETTAPVLASAPAPASRAKPAEERDDAPAAAPQPLQAVPFVETQAISAAPSALPAAAIEAAAAASAASARTEVLAEAVEAVAETIRVSPDLATRGEGEIRIRLKPDVLDGTEIRLEAHGSDLTVAFHPATADTAALLERHAAELGQLLSARVVAWRVSVAVRGAASRRDEA